MTIFDAVKQLELDVFCDVMFGTVKDSKTQDELKAALQTEITEKALQQINEAALREGHHPLSFPADSSNSHSERDNVLPEHKGGSSYKNLP